MRQQEKVREARQELVNRVSKFKDSTCWLKESVG